MRKGIFSALALLGVFGGALLFPTVAHAQETSGAPDDIVVVEDHRAGLVGAPSSDMTVSYDSEDDIVVVEDHRAGLTYLIDANDDIVVVEDHRAG